MSDIVHSALFTSLFLLFFACKPTISQFEDIDILSATDVELLQMQIHFSKKLAQIENAIKNTRKKRSVSPISASLPNRESAGFLSRIGAIKKSLEKSKNDSSTVTVSPTSTSENLDEPKPVFSSLTQKFDSGKFQHINDSFVTECKKLSQVELVAELKQKGTYNPELMAWDALGVIRFLDRTIHENYQKTAAKNKSKTEVIEKNVEALDKLIKELNFTCDLNVDKLRNKFHNISFVDPRRTVFSPSLRRTKRMDTLEEFLKLLNVTAPQPEFVSNLSDQPLSIENERVTYKQKLIGESHIVPFGCDKRGAEEDGYLRLCGACQAIRRLPDTFFPPFINEVTCDTDKACLYFYDYPHGKCRQKHMNFVVLRNVGTRECQVWKKFNLNVRVSCECFVGEFEKKKN
uniref:Spaetzle domain-containing protein n=1 Tax=Caenorhabditis japonica TaxID=281687 RepID=A0A8R1DM75_CAEJA